ncbi:hypothetical protein EHS25_008143 [Saitozyma podzolica]|uniref:Thioredoxin domain-containing protein n=1 Tax=Saitozyma podzolica TaxID=1890683 RepID=A0A427YNJ3_9TREE|nr:hypothetical protein EHS25_008143 [Saitozyma podzolica]
MRLPLVALVAASLLSSAHAGMYGQPVVNLDARTFKQALSVEHAAMVAFVAPWCGHCKALGPEYTAAAQSLAPLIPFYAVDCDEAGNKGLCAEYGIKGFPTIKAFPRALKGAARDYQGRGRRALVGAGSGEEAPGGREIEGVLNKFLGEKSNLPHALLIHPSAPSIPFLWKVLGHRFSSKNVTVEAPLTSQMLLGYIRDTSSHSVLSALGVYDSADSSRDATRVVVWQPDASRVELIEYDGVMKFNALLEFLQSHIDGTATPPPPSGSNQRQKPVEAPEPASPPTPSADEPKVAPTATGETAAERRARLQAKMDEQERRDQARREKLAAKATEAAHTRAPIEVEAESEAVDDDVIVDVTDQEVEGKIDVEATPAEAPSPSPEEGVQDELLEGQSPADELPLEPEEPVPAEAPSQEGVQPEQTVVHEEL